MALIQTNFYSAALRKIVTFHIILPNDAGADKTAGNRHYERPMKTLYLLHGFGGNSADWIQGSIVNELAIDYNIAVVMPSGENSFYLNGRGTGSAYETYTGVELVEYCRKTFGLSDRMEDTCIGGLSMGGFGAIHTGLQYPRTFGKVFAMSSALIVYNIAGMKPGTDNTIADYDYYERIFGNLEELDSSENNPEYLIRKLKQEGSRIPPLFMMCGTEDFLIGENRRFKAFLEQAGIDLTYSESSGIHNWKFWNENLEPAIQWLLK